MLVLSTASVWRFKTSIVMKLKDSISHLLSADTMVRYSKYCIHGCTTTSVLIYYIYIIIIVNGDLYGWYTNVYTFVLICPCSDSYFVCICVCLTPDRLFFLSNSLKSHKRLKLITVSSDRQRNSSTAMTL